MQSYNYQNEKLIIDLIYNFKNILQKILWISD